MFFLAIVILVLLIASSITLYVGRQIGRHFPKVVSYVICALAMWSAFYCFAVNTTPQEGAMGAGAAFPWAFYNFLGVISVMFCLGLLYGLANSKKKHEEESR